MLAVGALGGIGRLGLVAAAVRQLFDPRLEFFSNGEQGVWYEPSLTNGTLFQDSAGTTPVTAVEQPVGLMLDKSGRGNHAFQTTAIDRPILRNRYNLLTKTEQFGDAAWTKTAATIAQNTIIAPDGAMTAYRLTENSSTSTAHFCAQTVTATAGTRYTYYCYIKADSRSDVALYLPSQAFDTGFRAGFFNLDTGTVTASETNVSANIESTGNGWFKCSVSGTATATSSIGTVANVLVLTGKTVSYTGNGVSGLYVWGASLVPSDQVHLPYQRVNTATDYDSDPRKFPLYLSANGTNTWMQTNNIDFTGTDKVAVFAGVRKLSDAAAGIVCELSSSFDTNNGTFFLTAPHSAGVENIGWRSRGTLTSTTVTATGVASPYSGVLTGSGNIALDGSVLRVNGVQAGQSTADQGTGNYGNYPLYLFRRGGTSLPFNGNFYGLLIRGALTIDAQTVAMERWLAPKTGVTL